MMTSSQLTQIMSSYLPISLIKQEYQSYLIGTSRNTQTKDGERYISTREIAKFFLSDTRKELDAKALHDKIQRLAAEKYKE